jgi:predicted aspartyl protease
MLAGILPGLAGALVLATVQPAPPASLSDALEAGTPQAFSRALESGLDAPHARLATGLNAALSGMDDLAAEQLGIAMTDAGLEPSLQRRAAEALAGVMLRREDFDAAARAFDRAGEIEPLEAGAAQARAFVEPLRGLPRISRGALEPACVPVTRDLAGLPRADLTFGALTQDAIVDTGAAFSTVTASTAERLGIRAIEGRVSVGAAAVDALESGLGIADTLEIGGVRFSNVVFIILPDEALSFAGGQYTIEMILGMPVLMRLERLDFEHGETGGTLCFEPSAGPGAGESNLYLQGLAPIVLAQAEGADSPLHLLLDTGAQTTNLSLSALEHLPGLAASGEAGEAVLGGAGGMGSDAQAVRLPALTLIIGARRITLEDVMALSQGTAGRRDGILGQDVLSSGRGWRIDFPALTLELAGG